MPISWCDDSGWDTWQKSDLSWCTQYTIFSVPAAVFLLLFAFRAIQIFRRPITQLLSIRSRLTYAFVACMIMTGLAVASVFQQPSGSSNSASVLFFRGTQALGWIGSAAIIFMEAKRSLRPHWVNPSFWVAELVVTAKICEGEVIRAVSGAQYNIAAMVVACVHLAANATLWISFIVNVCISRRRAHQKYGYRGGVGLNNGVYDPLMTDETGEEEGEGEERPEAGEADENPEEDSVWSRFFRTSGRGGYYPAKRVESPVHSSVSAAAITSPALLSHPLAGGLISIPSWLEGGLSAGAGKAMQFAVRLRPSSGESSAATVWREYTDFLRLADKVRRVSDRSSIAQPPPLPDKPTGKATKEHCRAELEVYLRTLQAEPAYWNDLATFLSLTLSDPSTSSTPPRQTPSSVSISIYSPPPAGQHLSPHGLQGMELKGGGGGYSNPGSLSEESPWRVFGLSVTGWARWAENVSAGDAAAGEVAAAGDGRRKSVSSSSSSSSSALAGTFVTFRLLVQTDKGQWSLDKRLDDIVSLRQRLAAYFPKRELPVLRLIPRYDVDETALVTQQDHLRVFLQALALADRFQCRELWDFLAPSSSGASSSTLNSNSNLSGGIAAITLVSGSAPELGIVSSLESDSLSGGRGRAGATAAGVSTTSTTMTTALSILSEQTSSSSSSSRSRSSSSSVAIPASSSSAETVVAATATAVLGTSPSSSAAAAAAASSGLSLATSAPDESSRATLITSSVKSDTTPAADMFHRFAVSIPKWQRGDEKSKSKSTVGYTVQVQEYFDVRNYIQWNITRRYQEFATLHSKLKKQFATYAVPDLPPKIWGKLSDEQIAHRQRRLELYLQQLINTETFQCDELFIFLDHTNPSRNIQVFSS